LVDPKSLPDLMAAFDEIPNGGVHAWLTDPDFDSDSRSYWDTDSGKTAILNTSLGPGSWMTGGFILLGRAGEEFEDMGIPIEDGLSSNLPPESWKKLGEALSSGLAVKIPCQGESLSLRVEFTKSEKGVRGRASAMTQIVLFNTDEKFEEKGIGAHTFSGSISDIGNAVPAVP
jgi:hypothetical protein